MGRALYILLGALSALLGVVLALRVLPVSTSTRTGYYIHANLLTYPAQHRWTMATGWDLRDTQAMRANKHGFAAAHDFVAGSGAIGLVGDSYVEASMLALADRPAAQLERALGGRRPVYAMGGPGSSLLDYAERIRWAHQTLGLRDFVVFLESTDASQALCTSGNVHARCLQPGSLTPQVQRVAGSSLAKDVLRESALAQYLVSQLKFSAARLRSADFWRTGAPGHPPAARPLAGEPVAPGPAGLSQAKRTVIDAAIDHFLAAVAPLDGLRLLFVIDMNRQNLLPGVHLPDEGYHVGQRLRDAGHPVVAAEPLFRAHQQSSALRLDMGPHDGHLNSVGVGILMKAAASALQDEGFMN